MSMATTDNSIVRRGYLNVVRNPKDGMLGSLTSSVTSRRYWVVLRKETAPSEQSRLDLYRSEDQMFQGQPYREIGLDEVRSIQQLDQKKSFVVQLPSTSLLFMCSSRADLKDWVSDVRRFRTNRLSSIINGHGHADEVVAAGHEVYEVVPDDETFAVRLRKSSTLRFSGHCLLEILRDFERSLFHVALFTDEQPPRLIVKWQIDHIRQYGSNQMAFKFQSGRKSPTGVDWFILDTEPGVAARVHRAVDYWAQHIVEQANNLQGRSSSLPNPPRKPTMDRQPSSPPATSPQGQVYAGLVEGTKDARSVYDTPDNPRAQPGPANPSLPNAAGGGGASHYQPLQSRTMDTSVYDNETPYQDLNMQTREAAPPLLPRAPPSSSSMYMGLDPRARSTATEASYMDLKETRS